MNRLFLAKGTKEAKARSHGELNHGWTQMDTDADRYSAREVRNSSSARLRSAISPCSSSGTEGVTSLTV
jgi:hypothetical protein